MRDAGMVRHRLRKRFEDCGGLELAIVGFVGQVDRFVERERVENCDFRIVGIALVQIAHRTLVSRRACLLVDRVVALVEECDCLDPVAFALRRRVRRARLLDRLPSGLQQLLRERRHQRIGSLTHGDAPIRHRA